MRKKSRLEHTVTRSDINILLLDDDASILEISEKQIERRGYSCFTTQCPEEAISIIKKREPVIDILIVDYILKGMTGIEVIDQAREFEPSIYTILLTGLPESMPAEIAMDRYDINSYSNKKDSSEDLLLKIAIAVKSIEQNNFMGHGLKFEQKLRYLREVNNLSIDEVANYIGASKSTVKAYELGATKPEFEKLRLLGTLYKVSFDYLLR